MSRNVIQSANYDFVVTQIPHLTPKGNPSGLFDNYREDTDTILGTTSEQYGLIQNNELIQTAEVALHQRGMTDFQRRIIVLEHGKRMYAEYTFQNKQLKNAVGDIFGYRLTLQNSFDRSLRAAIELGLLRLTCLNGASTLEKEFGLTKKHSSHVTSDFVGEAIDKAMTNGGKALQVYDKMAEVAITDEQGLTILKNMELGGSLSGSLREAIQTLWTSPRRQEDKARNIYNLWNAITEHLTHGVANERYEYAAKISSTALLTLVNASRNPAKLSTLLLPIPSKDSTIIVDV